MAERSSSPSPSSDAPDEDCHAPGERDTLRSEPPAAPVPGALTTDDDELEDVTLDAAPVIPSSAVSPTPPAPDPVPEPTPVPTFPATFPPPRPSLPYPATDCPAPSGTSLHVPSRSSPDDSSRPASIYGVCLVGFDHAVGPTVEYAWPKELNENAQLLAEHLPFFALPDGAHARDEDYSYFHLFLPDVASSTIFGISCNRQIQSTELLNKGAEVTRSTVQKAIVVLASKPIFGPLRDKLGVVTRAFFAQKDFADKTILVDLFTSLEIQPEPRPGALEESKGEEGGMYMGTSLRELVYKFRFKTLMLLKLLMLQRRASVMFYAAHTPVESLCTLQYSLVALIPALLTHLEDAATPTLNSRSQRISLPSSLRTSDKSSLLRYLGLPLNIFGAGSFFQPYLPLQQIDMLKTQSYLVGTTNSIFQQQRDCQIDVLVNIETASLDILNHKLSSLLTLTAADRKWMDEIVTTVDNSWNGADPSRPIGGNFIGSDDFLRAKFEEYICSMLACIKFTEFLKNGERAHVLLSGTDFDSNMMTSFNESFIRAFKATPAFALWNATTDSVIFDLVEPRHPMEGKTNAIEDVGIRLAHGLHDLHLEENLAPTREAISRGVTTGSDALWKTYSFLRTDISKRQASGELSPPPLIANTVMAGVDVAKTGAATIATGIGSLFASSKRTLWARAPTPEPSEPRTPSRPASTSGYPPIPPPESSPTLSSFFRPLSTASSASVPVTTPEVGRPSPPNLGSGFFNPFRRSFSESLTPPSTVPPTPTTPSKKLAEDDPPLQIRDLDAEYEEGITRRAEAEAVATAEYPPRRPGL